MLGMTGFIGTGFRITGFTGVVSILSLGGAGLRTDV